MDDLASAFSGLPYFNPMMMINKSGTCATTKLIQCRDFGCYMLDISDKFEGNPGSAPDLSRTDFMARKIVISQVQRWAEKHGKENDEWVPIAYMYEIVKGSSKRTKDWGHLLFTDLTTTRFLIVMVFPEACNCGNFSHHDYDAMTKFQADRLMSLLSYLHHSEGRPDWVRATYVTPKNNYTLDPQFLSSTAALSPAEMRDRLAHKRAPLFHVTSENFVPSLRESDVEKIDSLLRMKGSKGTVPTEVRERTIGDKDTKLHVDSKMFKKKNPRECAFCGEVKETDLMVCARCKLVYYCGRECQRLAWPSHKLICKT